MKRKRKEKPVSTNRLARMIQGEFLDLRRNMATKEDLKNLATRAELVLLRSDLMATRNELKLCFRFQSNLKKS